MQKNIVYTRKEKAIQTKHRIYISAEQLFNKHGIESVSVEDIVKHAGVAKGSFYVHFESKYSLIALLINDYVKKVDTGYKTYLSTLPSDAKANEALMSLVGKIADVITNDIGDEKMSILYKLQLGNDIQSKAAMDYNRELYTLFCQLVRQGIEQRVFRSTLSVEEIARLFMVTFRGITYDWCIRYPELDLKEQASKHFGLLLTGLMDSSNEPAHSY